MTDAECIVKLEHAIRCAIKHPALPAFIADKLRDALADAQPAPAPDGTGHYDMMTEET